MCLLTTEELRKRLALSLVDGWVKVVITYKGQSISCWSDNVSAYNRAIATEYSPNRKIDGYTEKTALIALYDECLVLNSK